jgi:hypothetical protein
VEALEANPPAPVNLSRMARVFSAKVQFVECTLRGAQWTEREIKVESLLLNADVADDLAEPFDTKIRPFSKQADLTIPVQAMVARAAPSVRTDADQGRHPSRPHHSA